MRKIITNPSTFQQLAVMEDQFKQNAQEMAAPVKDAAPYHEYYRMENARGFVKITLPKRSGAFR